MRKFHHQISLLTRFNVHKETSLVQLLATRGMNGHRQSQPQQRAADQRACEGVDRKRLSYQPCNPGHEAFARWRSTVSTVGRIPVYIWGDALKWAQSRLGEPRYSTSEEDAIAAYRAAQEVNTAVTCIEEAVR